MKPRSIIPILAAPVFFAGSLHGEVKPNPLFSDGAVLQRGKIIPVWGTARDRETVTVEFEGQKVSTTAADGKWSLNLQPLKEGGPFTMKITGDNTMSVNNLLVGEVWLCSGQSNMHFRLTSVENAQQEIAASDHPNLRFFTVREQLARTPAAEVKGEWQTISPGTAAQCSAVAYYFGRELQRKLGVPVGLLVGSVGGTRIESWMRSEALAATGESSALVEKWKKVPADEFERIASAYRSYQYQRDDAQPKAAKAAKARGLPVPPPPEMPKIRCHDCPSALHNGMIAPLQPFAIRGAIWYQGESNSRQPEAYQKLQPALIADWRRVWGDPLPFLFVQIAPHRNTHPAFREAQLRIWQTTPLTAMAVTADVGDADNIHPTRKEPVGRRLALAAQALAYGGQIEYSGPSYDSMTAKDGKVVLSFKHVGGGLIAKDGDLRGFTIAGADRNFVPAKAEIRGANIILSAEGVADPKAARYGWANVPDGNLFNQVDLPASPFRTDADP